MTAKTRAPRQLTALRKQTRRDQESKQEFGILIVKDETNPAMTLRNILEATGYSTEIAPDGRTALNICRKKTFDLALIDINQPDISSGELIEELVKLSPEMEYIIVTGDTSQDSAMNAVQQKHIIAHETKPLNIDRCLSVMRQVTERKRVQRGMEQAAKEWRATFDAISDMISIHDKDFRIIRVNMAFANMVDLTPQEVIGRTCYELMHGTRKPWSQCPHRQVLADGKTHHREYFNPKMGIHVEQACSPIFDETGNVVASVHITRDITQRKKMEEQLIRTNRLASIGELASGIAHELNNPLTSIIGFSELLLAKDAPKEIKEDLQVINREAQRTAAVVKNLLTFARKHKPNRQPVNIHGVIRAVLELRAYDQKVNKIQVSTRLASSLPEIMADNFQLQQAFLNIVINAEYFMIDAHGGGKLIITTERVGDTVKISFADNGPGISKKNLRRLFDAFFTTKGTGKGTGLGLSISHGIITKSGGKIYAESEPGSGANFIVELPISQGTPAESLKI